MARRLILDTSILIEWERLGQHSGDFLPDEDDVAIAAVTVAEMQTGIELAGERQRADRADALRRILDVIPVESYDVKTAEVHGGLLAYAHRRGSSPGAHDLIIAATALVTNRTILTTDRRARFEELPGVDCILVD